MTYTEEEKKALRLVAQRARSEYRRYLRGLPSSWGKNLVEVAWWKATPERWAWLTKPRNEYISLPQLKEEVRLEEVSSQRQYWVASPTQPGWPKNPRSFYKEDWISWYDLFGKQRVEFLTLDQLKEAVEKAKVDSQDLYMEEQKKHPSWPSAPHLTYKATWVSWYDLFGKEKPEFISLPELKKKMKELGITTGSRYFEEQKKHPSWPRDPNVIYSDYKPPSRGGEGRRQREYGPNHHSQWADGSTSEEWVSWPNLFGRERPKFLSLPQLKEEVKKAGVKDAQSYRDMCKSIPEWPSSPPKIYKEWVSWVDLLGLPPALRRIRR